MGMPRTIDNRPLGDAPSSSAPSRRPGPGTPPLPFKVGSPTGRTQLGLHRWCACRLKPLAALVAALGVGLWCTAATVYGRDKAMGIHEPISTINRVFVDDGPGKLWVPPRERPIPLSMFPNFAGVKYIKRKRKGRAGGLGEEEGKGKPAVTLLFMHLWKCAGSSLRHMLKDWADLNGQSIGIVVHCNEEFPEDDKVCLQNHELIDAQRQGPDLRQREVLAGHFTWGFQHHVRQPYVMFTTLRNPLELFVSGQQYLNRKATRRFANAVELVGATMKYSVETHRARLKATEEGLVVPEGMSGKAVGFIYRLVGPEAIATKTLPQAAQQAMDNLDTFWLVGVVEQYRGFMSVLREMMDPLRRHPSLWKAYQVGKYNTSPNGAGKVLAGIEASSPGLVKEFNETLRHQWEVYDYAKGLFFHRCREVMHTRDYGLCSVPYATTEYAITERQRMRLYEGLYPSMTDLEREQLYQDVNPSATSFNASEILRAKALWSSRHDNSFGSSKELPFEEESVRNFFEHHGFNLSDPDRRNTLWVRLDLLKAISPSAEQRSGSEQDRGEVSLGVGHKADDEASLVRGKDFWGERNSLRFLNSSHEPPWRVEDASEFFAARDGFDRSDAEKRDTLLGQVGPLFGEDNVEMFSVVDTPREGLSLPNPRSDGDGDNITEASWAEPNLGAELNASLGLNAPSELFSRAEDASDAKEQQEREGSYSGSFRQG